VTQVAILYPVFVQVLLVYVVMLLMSRARRKAVATPDRETMTAIAMGKYDWPDDARKCAANYGNQFEMPVLFYAVVAFALIVKGADTIMIVLAWVFALSRLLHAYVHIGSNRVKTRMPVFALGAFVVLAMWVKLFLHVALA
jgi:hypothetical protein